MTARLPRATVAAAAVLAFVAVGSTLLISPATAVRLRGRPERGAAAELPQRFVPTAVSQRVTRRDIARRLARFRSPPGARLVGRKSALTDPVLADHFAWVENFVANSFAATRFAWTPESPTAALSWIVRNRPPGTLPVARREPNQIFAWLRCRFFESPSDLPYDRERLLQVCATTHRGGATLRIDSQAEWLEGRSPYSRIPRGTRILEVTTSRDETVKRRATVEDRRFIQRIVALANSLPIAQRGGPYCDGDEDETLELVFRTSRTGFPLASLSQPLPAANCPLMEFYLRGRGEAELGESGVLLRALRPVIDSLRAAPPAPPRERRRR